MLHLFRPRTFGLLAMAVLATLLPGGSSLRAQSYQTSFSEVKFDRAKGMATFHNSVKIDGATGALSAQWPLGPGIGARGVAYRPTVNLRWAPQFSLSGATLNYVDGYTQTAGSLTDGSTVLYPGQFNLVLDNGPAAQWGSVTNWELWDGSTGVLAGTLPAPAPGGLQPAATDIQGVLLAFGYSSAYTRLAPVTGGSGSVASIQNVNMGSNGELVIYLCKPGNPQGNQILNNPYAPGGGSPYTTFTYPDLVLVVQGETAFEFALDPGGPPVLQTTRLVVGAPSAGVEAQVYQSLCPRYHLSRILNRAGESVSFSYTYVTDSAGSATITGYSASWSASPATVTVTQTSTGAKVVYAGNGSNDPSYTIASTLDPYAVGDLEYWHSLQITSIQDNASGEAIGITYGTSPSPDSRVLGSAIPVISQITFPNRTLAFSWQTLPYARNSLTRDWQGFHASPFNAWFCGVTRIQDEDGLTGATRTTTHARQVPQLQATTYSSMPDTPTYCYNVSAWLSTTFQDIVTLPDGTTLATVYAAPPATPDGSGGFGGSTASSADQMATLLFLKHLPVEERRYEPGVFAASDLALPAEQSSAYHCVRRSQWKLNRPGNPQGLILQGSLPYPGTLETFQRQGGKVLKTTQTFSQDYDSVQCGWPQMTDVDEVDADGGGGPLQAVTRVKNTQWDYDTADWFQPRKTSEQTTTNSDSTGGLAGDVALPFAAPAATWSYGSLNQVLAQGTGRSGDPQALSLGFTYGTSGMAQILAQALGLTGTGDALLGAVGISQYGYDGAGFMNLIQQKGAAWNVQQGNDVYGRPTSQTDPNGNQVHFSWDASDRLNGIQPADGSVPTQILYDDTSHRIVTVKRQSETTEYHLNGFGELIQEVRYGTGSTSYRMTSYDSMGRRTFQTVWQKNTGSDGSWCAPSGPGEQIAFDGQGRVRSIQDANGVQTTRTYPDVLTTVTTVRNATVTPYAGASPVVEDLVTTSVKDAAGRLVSLTDPKNQTTTYRYDPLNRIKQVSQSDPGTGAVQVRGWVYDFLGRTVVLDQPESGVTYFTDFDVLGKAHTVVYGLPAGWRPASPNVKDASALGAGAVKTIQSTFDPLGRLTGVSASDGSVVQAFAYDQQSAGSRGAGSFGQSNARRVYARDGGVEQWFYYRSATPAGLLDELDTLVWSGGAPQSGSAQGFAQSFTYDPYGKRLTATVDGRRVRLGYDDAMGLPTTGAYMNPSLAGGAEQSVATAIYDAGSWQLSSLSWSGSLTSFGYDTDTLRLKTLTHGNGSGTTSWTYAYDLAGRLLNTSEDSYGVDELGRLVQAQVQRLNGAGSVTQMLGYDGVGNTWSNQISGNVPTVPSFNGSNFTFNGSERAALAKTNRLPATASGIPTGAQYDAQGNLTSIFKQAGSVNQQQVNLGYDALGRAVSKYDVAQGVTEAYAYTAEGLRVGIQQYLGGQLQKTKFDLYNDHRQMVSQYVLASGGTTVSLMKAKALAAAASGPNITAQISYTGPTGVATGTALSFIGTYTADCPVTKVVYSWDFGDGGKFSSSTTGSASHTYTSQGVFTVTLRVSPAGVQNPNCTNTVVPAMLAFTVVNRPAIASFGASASALNAGQSLTLSWSTTNTTSVSVSGLGTLGGTSYTWKPSVPGSSPVTYSYVLTATNTLNGVSFSATSQAVQVTVYPNPTAPRISSFSAGSSTIMANHGGTTLNWSVDAGTVGTLSVSLNGAGVQPNVSGYAVNPPSTTTYTLTATSTELNQTTSVQATVVITVLQPPTITSFTAGPASVAPGGATTLAWSIQNATSITLNGDPLPSGMAGQGSLAEAPAGTTTYTLVATNQVGSVTATQTVTVSGTGSLAWVRDVVYLGEREVAEFDNAGMHVTQTDHLGSPRFVMNASGVVESQQKYLPFGETLDQTGSLTTAKGFTGHEQTDGSGLVYMQARFYLPQYHRFTSPDPARDQHFEDTQSWNIYSYVRNAPNMNVDPTGMEDVGVSGVPKSTSNISPENQSGYDLGKKPYNKDQVHQLEDEAKASRARSQAGLQPNQNGVAVDSGGIKGQFSIDRLNPSNNPDPGTTGRAIYAEGEAGAKGATGEVGVAKGDASLFSSKYFDLSFSTKALTAEGQATIKPSKTGDASGKNDQKEKMGIGLGLGATATLAKAQFTATIKMGPLHLDLKGGFTCGAEAGIKGGSKGIGADLGAILKLGAALSWGH